MTTVLTDDPTVPAWPRARLRLEAHPAAIAAAAHALDALAVGGAPSARLAADITRPLFVHLTGGLDVVENPDLAPGAWRVDADGRRVLSGTVTAP